MRFSLPLRAPHVAPSGEKQNVMACHKKRVVVKCFSLYFFGSFLAVRFREVKYLPTVVVSTMSEFSDYSQHSTPTEEYYRDQREGFLNSLLVDDQGFDTGTVTNTPAHVSFVNEWLLF